LDQAGITANKNAVPFEKERFTIASGLRLGTAALTTRGLIEADIDVVSEFIIEALGHTGDDNILNKIRSKVEDFVKRFPLYQNRRI
jgi:glycine hydroxymethyltransferase